jgi:hypothetical protein
MIMTMGWTISVMSRSISSGLIVAPAAKSFSSASSSST